jgi:CubicO group peptidase (beta-lactamase class C family)
MIMQKRLIFIIACLLVPLSKPAYSATSGSLAAELDAERLQANIAGLYAVTITATESGSESKEVVLGVTNHKTQEPFTANHYIRLGSISKLFLGLTLLQLEAKGTIALTDALNLKPPIIDNSWDRPVTLAQLMEHTAGLGDMTQVEWASKTPLTSGQAFLLDPASRRLKWPPGMHSSYSNSGSGIAAYYIEQISNKPFDETVQSEVLTPLELNSATYRRTQNVEQSLITGYDSDGTSVIPYWHMLYRAFGGLNIRATEMQRVLKMLLHNGSLDDRDIFSPELIERLSTPTTTVAARNGLHHGYGMGLYHYQRKGFSWIGHGGDADGYLSYLAFSPRLGKGYFVVINAFNNRALRNMRHTIEDDLSANEKRPDIPNVHKISAQETRRIVGKYAEQAYRFRRQGELVVFSSKGQLYTRLNQNVSKLIPVTSHHYRRKSQTTATIAIVEEDGFTYFQGDEGNFRRTGP